jgi:hypothetical protein
MLHCREICETNSQTLAASILIKRSRSNPNTASRLLLAISSSLRAGTEAPVADERNLLIA